MPRTRPRRLSHVLMFTTDVRKAIEFYTRVLGMRLSDHSSDNIAFLHGIHGSDHHMIAFARSNAPGHHHFSWDVGSVDEIGAGAMHMLDKGFTKGWGSRAPRARLKLLPLRAGSVGKLQRIFGGYRLHPRHLRLGGGGSPPGRFLLCAGARNVPEDFVHNYEA